MQDESLHDATIPVDDAEDIMVEYYMVDSGTERGKRKLVDSTGFSYTVKVRPKERGKRKSSFLKKKPTYIILKFNEIGNTHISFFWPKIIC